MAVNKATLSFLSWSLMTCIQFMYMYMYKPPPPPPSCMYCKRHCSFLWYLQMEGQKPFEWKIIRGIAITYIHIEYIELALQTSIIMYCIVFLVLPPLLFALQAEQLFLVPAISNKTSHHTHLQHAKISQKSQRRLVTIPAHSQLWGPASQPLPPFFSWSCYILPEVGAWSNVTITSILK